MYLFILLWLGGQGVAKTNYYVFLYLLNLSTNCSAERSFSVLKRVKNYLRSTMNQDRCYALALLIIKSEITGETDFEEMITLFPNPQSRRKL